MTHQPLSQSDFELQLQGYRLTTAEITYHMPDTPSLLQTFVWQQLDLAPRYPRLVKFLDFWQSELDGPLHSVRVGATEILAPGQWGHLAGINTLQ